MIRLVSRRLQIYCIGLLAILVLFTLRESYKFDTLIINKQFTTHLPYDPEQLAATTAEHATKSSETTDYAETLEAVFSEIRHIPTDPTVLNDPGEHVHHKVLFVDRASQKLVTVKNTDLQDVTSHTQIRNETTLETAFEDADAPSFVMEKEADKWCK